MVLTITTPFACKQPKTSSVSLLCISYIRNVKTDVTHRLLAVQAFGVRLQCKVLFAIDPHTTGLSCLRIGERGKDSCLFCRRDLLSRMPVGQLAVTISSSWRYRRPSWGMNQGDDTDCKSSTRGPDATLQA